LHDLANVTGDANDFRAELQDDLEQPNAMRDLRTGWEAYLVQHMTAGGALVNPSRKSLSARRERYLSPIEGDSDQVCSPHWYTPHSDNSVMVTCRACCRSAGRSATRPRRRPRGGGMGRVVLPMAGTAAHGLSESGPRTVRHGDNAASKCSHALCCTRLLQLVCCSVSVRVCAHSTIASCANHFHSRLVSDRQKQC